ncbi:MAG: hypothetical protein EZS28_015606, partial [Streblomastix strix]
QPSARTGSAAMPQDLDPLLKEADEEAPNEYVNILQQQDGEQVPSQALPQEDAIQQRGVQDQLADSANTFIQGQLQQGQAKDQMSEDLQENNDEIIKGLKYVVGATDRKYQWYTNEGQTVLRQAQRIQLPTRSRDSLTYIGEYLLLNALCLELLYSSAAYYSI